MHTHVYMKLDYVWLHTMYKFKHKQYMYWNSLNNESTGPVSGYYQGSTEEGDSPPPLPHMALSHYLSQPYCSAVGHHPHVSVHKSHVSPDPPVPLLLHPDIMPSTPVQFVTPQVSTTACPG